MNNKVVDGVMCSYIKQWRTRGGGLGCSTPTPRNSEGLPKSCQTQPDLWKLL